MFNLASPVTVITVNQPIVFGLYPMFSLLFSINIYKHQPANHSLAFIATVICINMCHGHMSHMLDGISICHYYHGNTTTNALFHDPWAGMTL